MRPLRSVSLCRCVPLGLSPRACGPGWIERGIRPGGFRLGPVSCGSASPAPSACRPRFPSGRGWVGGWRSPVVRSPPSSTRSWWRRPPAVRGPPPHSDPFPVHRPGRVPRCRRPAFHSGPAPVHGPVPSPSAHLSRTPSFPPAFPCFPQALPSSLPAARAPSRVLGPPAAPSSAHPEWASCRRPRCPLVFGGGPRSRPGSFPGRLSPIGGAVLDTPVGVCRGG